MKPILEIQGIGKKYRIRHQTTGYLSLRERLLQIVRFEYDQQEDFWALQDVSFTVEEGESVGIIGRNGAGKSTLLKILSKITPPTQGRIIKRGRIASLLEVGTGFHPELTGRENIFLNGSLLGMKRKEIIDKLEEIVDFSGVEKFLDTPLKHYSSGMQLRLAFSVAAFLEPEILIIDEVLAVGDLEFQKKCLGKMEDVSKGGRSILFVSHNLQAVMNLCKKGIYLKNGRIDTLDSVRVVIDNYLLENQTLGEGDLTLRQKDLKQDKDFQLTDIVFYQDGKRVYGSFTNGKEVTGEVHYRLLNPMHRFRIFLDVCDQMGNLAFRSFHDEDSPEAVNLDAGEYVSSLIIPEDLLAPITYEFRFRFGIHNVRMVEPVEGVSFKIKVEQTGNYNRGYSGQYTEGIICPVLDWEIRKS
jgi:lipopolysaccharide transport system ATP-binding protein